VLCFAGIGWLGRKCRSMVTLNRENVVSCQDVTGH